VQVQEAERTQKFHCATEAQATTLSMVLAKVGEGGPKKSAEQKPST
jgi:2-methylcitrate dehydratase PrpD